MEVCSDISSGRCEITMTIELWIGGGDYWFVDRDLGHVQVGQAHEDADGAWRVVVNDDEFIVPDLEAAKRVFLEHYDRSQVELSPMSAADDSEVDSEGFEVITLT
jgi:hypothetical protein